MNVLTIRPLTGSDLSITASMMLKMAVLAPMPRARDRMAMTANPGLLRSRRRAKRMSCI